MANNRKGYIYIVEVLLAIGIMLGAIFFIFNTSTDVPDFSNVIIEQTGMDALTYLDNKGNLREYVQKKQEPEIEAMLGPLISDNIGYEVEICRNTCIAANITNQMDIITVDYFISGYRDNYIGKRVRLWLWSRV